MVSVMRVKYALLLALLAAAVLTGCTGGTGNSAAIPSQSQSLSSVQSLTKQPSHGNVTFAIGITPRSKAPGTRDTPQYVSVSTQSLNILTDRGNPVTVNLTPSSPNCSPKPGSPDSYICTARLNVPTGNHVFMLTAYDRTGGAGNVLSRNSTGTVYVKPTGTITVSIVLRGVVQYVTLKTRDDQPRSRESFGHRLDGGAGRRGSQPHRRSGAVQQSGDADDNRFDRQSSIEVYPQFASRRSRRHGEL
jgi:hypothetical protein